MSQAKALLERLRTRRLPVFGSLNWDGRTGELAISVTFELSHSESAETVCERAYRFFLQLSDEEWAALDIEITIRQGKPVRAILKPRIRGVITTGRLQELEAALKT